MVWWWWNWCDAVLVVLAGGGVLVGAGVVVRAPRRPFPTSANFIHFAQILSIVRGFAVRVRQRDGFGHDDGDRWRHVVQQLLVGRVGWETTQESVKRVTQP